MPEVENKWDFDTAINLLKQISLPTYASTVSPDSIPKDAPQDEVSLGNFNALWDFLGQPHHVGDIHIPNIRTNDGSGQDDDDTAVGNRAIRWRDEIDGADLEDNIEPIQLTAANLRTAKRAARRARARERAEALGINRSADTDTATDYESAGEELESLRRSPDRKAVIEGILGRFRPAQDDSPPTSPSPPKQKAALRDLPISHPFLWQPPQSSPGRSHRPVITAQDGLTSEQRKHNLIKLLRQKHGREGTYLKSPGVALPEFTTLNTSTAGVHVFIDMSNISIGFHDCLKLARGFSRDVFVRRIPMDFHNFSLVLERGRPAAKRIIVGSDRSPVVLEAETLGYETNILERVYKAKELTPRQKKFAARSGGETSGSETNTGYPTRAVAKMVEQAVDEILHLKILESIVDSAKPSTIVLATGDAAEAEYSGGFMKMVERALSKGWMVELISFRPNTSSMYLRVEFRDKWRGQFKVIHLDDFAEYLIKET